MSGTVSAGREAGRQEGAGTARPSRHRRAAAVVLVLLVLGAGAGAAWAEGAFQAGKPSGTGQGAPAPATAAVAREDLSSVTPVNATLGYADTYTVRGRGGGVLTSLPSQGQVVSQGQVLYQTGNASPVVLLYGTVPAWRTLAPGVTGQDVEQLNHDLSDLGDASSSGLSAAGWDYFSSATQAGVQKLQSALGISSPPGSLALGSVVFEPGPIRVSNVTGALGGPADGPVLTATSDRHVVTVPLPTAQETDVRDGDTVTVTLPDGTSTPGTITSVGTVASGNANSATIQVTVTLSRPSAAGTLDQAPVTVYITTATVDNVLAVPVGALLSQPPGGYAVEVTGPGNTRRLVAVSTGIFNDNSGMVQVSGALVPGERVVVPAS